MQAEFIQLPRGNNQFVVINANAICSAKSAAEGDVEIRTMDGQKFIIKQSAWSQLYDAKLKKRVIWPD